MDDDFDDFLEDDEEWEDQSTYDKLVKEMPSGWQMVKVIQYTAKTLIDVREWCEENCQGRYKEVNWSGYCSYSTAVQFEFDMDTVLFKLRWG